MRHIPSNNSPIKCHSDGVGRVEGNLNILATVDLVKVIAN